MKEATGELSVTVIAVVAIAAIATLFYTLVWPAIQKAIVDNTCATYGDKYEARLMDNSEGGDKSLNAGTARSRRYKCCPKSGTTGDCITLPD